jgi:hypothetical protein
LLKSPLTIEFVPALDDGYAVEVKDT